MALFAITLSIPTTAQAGLKNTTTQVPTIAILDTAIDTSIPFIKDRIVHEVCITEYYGCNGMPFAEGAGSATLPSNFISANGFDHGTQMVSVALQANPNLNIVFVRVIGNSRLGYRHPSGELTVVNALDWVINNKSKFNIQAVSMSQAARNTSLPTKDFYMSAAGTDYCPKKTLTQSKIQTLTSMNVGVFLPAGNDSDIKRINWPACIPESIAIGATVPNKEIASYSNYDASLLDFYALGTFRGTAPGNRAVNIAGTSASTVYAASVWTTIKTNNPSLTYKETYDMMIAKSVPTKNSKITNGRLINNG